MGRNLKLPRYVHGYIDCRGKPRFYFRRAGFKKVRLPGLPWSPEFMAAHEAALAGQPIQIGAARIKQSTIRALAVSYFGSLEFISMKANSQSVRRNIIERFCRETDKNGHQFGDKSAATLNRQAVIKLMAARAEKPESANGLRKALRAMLQHAVEIGLRADDPTRDVKAIRVKSDGFHSWTDKEIAQFEKRHPAGSRARLALRLLLYTGQRRSDVIRMGRQHIQDGWLHVRQQKTGRKLDIPVLPPLAETLAEMPTEHLTFLVTEFGKPFTPAGFGNWFRNRCNEAGLPHCSAHGLRKAAAARFADAGCTPHEIAAWTGHRSLREIVRYTEAADQKRLAASAAEKVKRRTSSG
jgi:integrase